MAVRIFWTVWTIAMAGIVSLSFMGKRSSGPDRMFGYLVLSIPVAALLIVAALVFFIKSDIAKWVGSAFIAFPMLMMLFGTVYDHLSKLPVFQTPAGNDDFRDPAQRNLAHAIAARDAALVATLIPKAGDLNRKGPNGETLLRFAVTQDISAGGDPKIVKLLLDAGANPNLPVAKSLPLSFATGHPELMKVMLEAGADPNRRDSAGRPLWWDSLALDLEPRVETTRILLDHGVDLTLTDREGMNAAAYAAWQGGWKQLWLVMERGVEWRGQLVWGRPIEEVVLAGLRDAKGQGWKISDELTNAAEEMSGQTASRN